MHREYTPFTLYIKKHEETFKRVWITATHDRHATIVSKYIIFDLKNKYD